MLPDAAKSAVITQILPPIDAAATANATSAWVAVPVTEGCLVFTQEVGAIGAGATLTGTLQTATSDAGAGAVPLLPDDGTYFTVVAAANKVETKVVNARKNLGYVKYTGTIAVGTPVAVSVSVLGRPKTTT